jgi:uncharacterized protein (TIRG00374 family)
MGKRAENISLLDRRSIKRGIGFFLFITVASLTIIFFWKKPPDFTVLWKSMKPIYLIPTALIATLDWLGGGVRLFIFARKINPKITVWSCVEANLANIFMGAVTPAQTGGGPSQIYVLCKQGLRIPQAFTVTLMTFIATVLYFVFIIPAAFALGHLLTKLPPLQSINYFLKFSAGFCVIFLIVLFITLSKPKILRKIIALIFKLIRFRKVKSKSNQFLEGYDESHELLTQFLFDEKKSVFYEFLITIVMFFSAYIPAYWIIRSLGVDADFIQLMLIQIVLSFAIYFSPTPGGSGTAELGSAALMQIFLPANLLGVYTVLWRLLVRYIAVVIGGIVMLKYLGKEIR